MISECQICDTEYECQYETESVVCASCRDEYLGQKQEGKSE